MADTTEKRKREEDGDYQPGPDAASAAAKKPRAKKLVVPSTSVGSCSLNKKDFGDRIKDALRLEKYAIQRMRIDVAMDVAFFRSFFGGNATITPPEYDQNTAVVVAELNSAQAGIVFGVSKIKNGNRYSTYHLHSMMVVFYPPTGKASCWVTI
ncbi:hypothetical protein LshimejAT787_1002600 [Lyophyllum shimeji]|uniref:Uncharacterized protein n=1 Tax=Lyophyllum shimeji TaxID=47721 RepID=A0A9P3PTD4_LYOSH|nr:hypothetical protein LshimejAT787_1002600 [Lyophyllum shimeji]